MFVSIAAISYSSLSNASGEAKDVSKKLSKYSDAINDKVYKKLNKYDGKWTSNLSSAKSNAKAKMDYLDQESQKYSNYATELKELKTTCSNTDKAVRSKVSSLTAQFKSNNGIRNSHIANAFNYLFTSSVNKSAGGRYLNHHADEFKQDSNYLKDTIKMWYNYEGGKELIKGVASAVLAIVVAVAGVVATILTGGAFLVILAAVVSAVIAVGNAIVNIMNESKAYSNRQNGDPAMGYRHSKLDTFADSARAMSNNKFWHNFAAAVEITDTICTVITLASGFKDLLKNGYKWATGNADKLADISMKNVLSKDTFSKVFTKLKTNFSKGFTDISKTIKTGNFSNIAKSFSNFKSDFMFNLGKEFSKFTDFKDAKSTFTAIKNIAFMEKLVFDKVIFGEKGSLKEFGFELMEKFVFPSINMGQITTIKNDESGQGYFDFGSIKFSDFFKNGKSTVKTVDKVLDLFSHSGPIKSDVLDKLNMKIDVNINVPDIHVPKVNIPVIRTAA